MVVCQPGSTYCPFTIVFGTISILFLILVDIVLLKFNKRLHISTLFIARFLCIIMILEYLLPFESKILFFMKEFTLLISYCATAYYFIFQAGFILFEYTLYRYILYGSLILTAFSLVCLIVYFCATLLFLSNPMPCNAPSWIIMRTLGLGLSILCVIISLWIQIKVSKLSEKLNLAQLKNRITYLWLINFILIYCNLMKFSETLAYYLNDVENCFVMLSLGVTWPLVMYGLILLSTDYSLIVLVVFIFFKTISSVKREQSLLAGVLVETNRHESEDKDFEVDLCTFDIKRSRSSSGSIKDYIMYSN